MTHLNLSPFIFAPTRRLLFAVLLLMFSANQADAQIPLGVEVNIFPPYPTQYNVWIGNGSNYMITIQNNSDAEFEYYIRAGIEGESAGEETFARISDQFFPLESLNIGPFEVVTITSNDLEDIYRNATVDDLDRSPNVPLDIDGELPEGVYMLCFELMLYDQGQEVFLSPKICSDPFTVSHNTLQLVYPNDGSVWDATDVPVTFQWLQQGSNTSNNEYEYELSLFEIDPNSINDESIYEYIETGGAVFFRSEPTPDLNFIYDVDFGLPDLTEGKLYAARAQVVSSNGEYFDGGGVSNINTFWYGYNPQDDGGGEGDDDETVDCFERCQPIVPTNTTAMSSYADLEEFEIGNFTVQGLELEDVTAGIESISGTGFVTFYWMNELSIEVQFSGVVVNTEGQAVAGSVVGVVAEANRNIVDIVGGIIDNFQELDQDVLNQLSDVVSNLLVVNKIRNGAIVDLPFGLSQQVGGQTFTFSMVGFEATPQGATMDVVNILDFSSLGDGFRLGLGASDICVADDGPGSEYQIHLIGDPTLPIDGGISVTFKGGQAIDGANYDIRTNQKPCYIEMSCDGFKAVNISGIVDFPESMMVKEVEGLVVEGENARGYFSTTYERDYSQQTLVGDPAPRTDFILDMVMDDFQLSKLRDWTFRINNMSFDLSESANPTEFQFPEGYINNDFAEDLLWKGFYIKDAEILTPKSFTDEGARGSGAINHILIDNQISMDVEAYGLLQPSVGSFNGWSLGIDTFELKILQNTLQHGLLDGKFSAPVMKENEYIDFNANLDENFADGSEESYYTFDAWVSPATDMTVPMAIASASICQNSYLAAKFTPIEADRQIELFLKGDIDINTGEYGTMITGNAHMRLADYQLHYNSVDGFVVPGDLDDGRGTYFGANDNEELDCSDLSYTTYQEAFDFMMDQLIDNTEGVLRDIAVDTDMDVEEEGGGQFRDGDQMEGLPIRFDKSNLTIVEGEPILELIVEAQLTPQSITEAGIRIESGIRQVGRKFVIEPSDISLYYTEGSIVLNEPVDGSSLVTNEPITVSWGANFQDQSILDDLRYKITMIPIDSSAQINLLDSLFRQSTTSYFSISDLTGNTHDIPLTDITPAMVTGKQYAIRVQATHIDGDVLNNDGYTGISLFTWGQTAIVGTNAGNNSACAERCSPSLPTNQTAHASPTTIDTFRMGNFTVTIEGTPQQSGDLISGEGTVQIDFLNNVNLEVTFTDVKVNTDLQALQGSIVGREEDPDLIDQVAGYIVGNNGAEVIPTLYQFLDESRMITDVLSGGTINLPFGIDVSMSSGDGSGDVNSVNVAFTDFQLTPTTSDIDFLFLMSLPSLGEGLNFGLGAQDICVSPAGFGSEARLYLPDDLEIPIDGETELKFNGGTVPLISGNESIDPFYLEIDCDGFKAVNISGSVTFPRTMLVKEDIVTGQIIANANVKGYFGMNLERTGGDGYTSDPGSSRTDLILSYTMDPFQIKGLDGWGFEVTEAVLDLSEAQNQPGMNFPANYDDEDLPQIEFWTGFYLKNLSFRPPSAYTESDGAADARISYSIENLLIDPTFTATFTADNLLSYDVGNIKGWGMSIDSFGLTILQNNFVSAGMKGEMGAPIMEDEDRLLYRAVVDAQVDDEEEVSYLFRAIVRPPSDGISIPMMVAAADICGSSYVGVQLGTDEDETQLELFLKATLTVDFAQFGAEIPGNFELALADFQVQYNTVSGFVMESESSDGKGTAIGLGLGSGDVCTGDHYFPDFDAMVDDYRSNGGADTDRSVAGTGVEETDGASNTSEDGTDTSVGEDDDPDAAKNAMNGFPIRLGGFDLSLNNGLPSVSFVVDLALASGGQGFAAGTGLTIYTKKEPNAQGKEKIKFGHVGFDCARLAVDMDFMELLACLCYSDVTTDAGTAKGYAGRIMVNAMDQIFVDLQAGFLTWRATDATNFGTPDYHAYWYIDGQFASNSGIPIGPLRLNAIGGGIYWNMNPPLLPGQDALDEMSPAPDGEGDAVQMVNDCIVDLAAKYNIDMPTGGQPLDNAPTHVPPSGNFAGTYGKRTIKLNAGLTFADPKFVIFDPLVQVSWTANQGIDEITVGGYMYFLQDSYFARGGSSAPPKDDEEGGVALENDAKVSSGSGGSKLWLAAFNSIYFDRASIQGKTLTAFHGYGGLYLNIIPDVLYGDDASDQQYRMIAHDIVFTHKSHARAHSLSNGNAANIAGDIYWHAHLGNPYNPDMGRGRLVFDLAGAAGGEGSSEPTGDAAIEVTAYAMLGHGIPSELPPPPQLVLDILEGRIASEGEEEDSGYDGERVSESDASREDLNDVTSGFAFGVAVGVNASFEKIIYANLQIVLGMDILFMNVAGMQCIAPSGTIYDPPGVNNYYGLGQIFAGLKGAVGVRGKILGKEIDVEFLSLAAAMLIQAGGPNPFWIDGRAAVRYSVLGGLIKGEAQVEVQVGDKCYPYNADPFNLDIISKVWPAPEDVNSRAVDPYGQPKITFKMPVALSSNPEIAKMTIPEVDPDGNTGIRVVAPVLMNFALHNSHTTPRPSNRENTQLIFSSTRRSARLKPDVILADSDQQQYNKDYTIKLSLKAMEKKNGSWSFIPDFVQDSVVQFQAGPMDPYEKYVIHTNPIRGQRYFMPEEWRSNGRRVGSNNILMQTKSGFIKFYTDIRTQRLYDRDLNNNQCFYELVWRDGGSGEEVDRYRLSPTDIMAASPNRCAVKFPIPDLDPSTVYVLQMVRIKMRNGLPILTGELIKIAGKGVNTPTSAQYDVSNDYQIEFEEDDTNQYAETEPGETLVHLVVFKTSAFDNMDDKIASANIDVERWGSPIYNSQGQPVASTAYDAIMIDPTSETFDEIEFIGHTEALHFDGGTTENFYTKPRIMVLDPFEGFYFDDHVKPMMNALLTAVRSRIDGDFAGRRGRFTSAAIYETFIEAGYHYLNDPIYDSGGSDIYGNASVRLDDFAEGSSYFASTISQSAASGLMHMLNSVNYGGTITYGGSGQFGTIQNHIRLKYDLRPDVKEDITDLVNTIESTIDNIRNPPYVYLQTWTDATVDSHLQPVFEAYNDLVDNNIVYSGNNSPITYIGQPLQVTGTTGWGGGAVTVGSGDLSLYGSNFNPPPFRASDIRFYYNINRVDSNYDLRDYGSSSTVEIDD